MKFRNFLKYFTATFDQAQLLISEEFDMIGREYDMAY